MHETLADETARAEATFLAGAQDLLDEGAVAWHRAAGLMRLARRQLNQWKGDRVARARALLGEAARLAEASG